MKRANGMGTIVKLTGNRRKPYAIRKVIGWKEDGRPKLKYISYHRTKREAERALKEYNDDPFTISSKTLAEVFIDWYASVEGKRADKTLAGYRSIYNHLEPLYDVKMRDIDRITLQKYYDNVDVSKDTMGRIRNMFNMLFKYAVRRGILPTTALALNEHVLMPDKPEKHYTPRSVISKQDIDMLWKLKDTDEYARIILVYIYTGLRFVELHDLKPEHCHDNYIDIVDSKTPAGVRIVPLSDKVKSLLPIISVPPHSTFWYIYKSILPDHVIHDTRHTFISLMVEAKVDPRVIKAIVGHKSNDITDHYTHISLDVMLDAVNQI